MAQEPYAGLATTFDTAAELYERASPGYPSQLFADLAASTGLRAAGARVLEVGTGTGQATRGLLERGWSVHTAVAHARAARGLLRRSRPRMWRRSAAAGSSRSRSCTATSGARTTPRGVPGAAVHPRSP